MENFNLELVLKGVSENRTKPKLTKSQKVWYQAFDDLYSNKIKNSNDIINIILEQGNKK